MRLVSETSIAFRKWSSQVRGSPFTTSKQGCISSRMRTARLFTISCSARGRSALVYPRIADPPDADTHPWMQYPRMQTGLVMWPVLHAEKASTNDWKTGVNILRCPKVCLRAVKSGTTDLVLDYTLNVVKFLTPRSREMNVSHSIGNIAPGPWFWVHLSTRRISTKISENVCVTWGVTLFCTGVCIPVMDWGMTRLLCIKHDFSFVFE